MSDIFKQASKAHLRFPVDGRVFTVEDLWGLPLAGNGKGNLNAIAIDLHKTVTANGGVSFVKTAAAKKDNLAELQLEIVKAVIADREAEQDLKTAKAAKAAKRAQITDLMARKQNEALEGKDLSDLQKLLEELGDD